MSNFTNFNVISLEITLKPFWMKLSENEIFLFLCDRLVAGVSENYEILSIDRATFLCKRANKFNATCIKNRQHATFKILSYISLRKKIIYIFELLNSSTKVETSPKGIPVASNNIEFCSRIKTETTL